MTEGPSAGIDSGRQAQIAASSNSSPSPQQPLSMDDYIMSLFNQAMKVFEKFVPVPKNTMETSLFANANVEQAAPLKNTLPGLASYDTKGGALSMAFANFMQKPDFSAIASMGVDPLTMNSGVDVSPAELGTLASQSFEGMSGMGRGGGMDMNV